MRTKTLINRLQKSLTKNGNLLIEVFTLSHGPYELRVRIGRSDRFTKRGKKQVLVVQLGPEQGDW